MYESFYGLSQRPFSATPIVDCCAALPTMQNAFSKLIQFMESGQGIYILSAPSGTGKTLLCQKLIDEVDSSVLPLLLVNANYPTRRSLLQSILYELGHPYSRMGEQELRLELLSALRSLHQEGRCMALIVDEAHALNTHILEEIRVTTNHIEDGDSLVRVVLSGQLSLEEKLASNSMEALNQRVAGQVTLEPYTRQESADYINYRIEWAGGNTESIFTPEALQTICYAADGNPRCLNQLCDHSLLLGFVSQLKLIDPVMVHEALDDLKRLPLHWNPSVPAADSWETTPHESDYIDSQGASDSPPYLGFEHETGSVEVGSESSSFEVGAGNDHQIDTEKNDDSAGEYFEVGAPQAADNSIEVVEHPIRSGCEVVESCEVFEIGAAEESESSYSCIEIGGDEPAEETPFQEDVVPEPTCVIDKDVIDDATLVEESLTGCLDPITGDNEACGETQWGERQAAYAVSSDESEWKNIEDNYSNQDGQRLRFYREKQQSAQIAEAKTSVKNESVSASLNSDETDSLKSQQMQHPVEAIDKLMPLLGNILDTDLPLREMGEDESLDTKTNDIQTDADEDAMTEEIGSLVMKTCTDAERTLKSEVYESKILLDELLHDVDVVKEELPERGTVVGGNSTTDAPESDSFDVVQPEGIQQYQASEIPSETLESTHDSGSSEGGLRRIDEGEKGLEKRKHYRLLFSELRQRTERRA